MTTLAQDQHTPTGFTGWLLRAESWLDEKGKAAWIIALVLSFVFAWPLGLLLLAYMIWSHKMTCTSRRKSHAGRWSAPSRPTGNSAFDAYRDETLRRLEDEQQNFEAFLKRLRAARDKAEFDQFMEERSRASASTGYDTASDRA